MIGGVATVSGTSAIGTIYRQGSGVADGSSSMAGIGNALASRVAAIDGAATASGQSAATAATAATISSEATASGAGAGLLQAAGAAAGSAAVSSSAIALFIGGGGSVAVAAVVGISSFWTVPRLTTSAGSASLPTRFGAISRRVESGSVTMTHGGGSASVETGNPGTVDEVKISGAVAVEI